MTDAPLPVSSPGSGVSGRWPAPRASVAAATPSNTGDSLARRGIARRATSSPSGRRANRAGLDAESVPYRATPEIPERTSRANAAEKRIPQASPTVASMGASPVVFMFLAGQPDARPRPKAGTGRRSPLRIYGVFRPMKRPAATRASPKRAIRGAAEAVFGRLLSTGAAGAGGGGA